MEETILFYDGPCALCNYAVRKVKKYDKKKRIGIKPIGSPASLQIKEVAGIQEQTDSVILWHNGIVYTHSEALIQLGHILQGHAKLLKLIAVIPRVLRDGIYIFIAKNRYRWFGKQNYCHTESTSAPRIKVQRLKH